MKLFIAIAVCATVFAGVAGKKYEYDCIRMDIDGTVTVTATENGTMNPVVIPLSSAKSNETGNCSQSDSVQMTVTFEAATWVLKFKATDGKVTLDQTVSFNATALFNSSAESVTVSSNGSLPLSSNKQSYECDSGLTLTFAQEQQSNTSFKVVQNITSLKVQAFGLPGNKSYSPAEHCNSDTTTVGPTTTTAAPPIPSPPPSVKAQTFVVKDEKDVVCFRLVAGLQFVVEFENKANKTVLSKSQVIPGSANVTGTCATGDMATMVIAGEDFSLSITETRDKGGVASSSITLNVTMDSKNFPDAKNENETMSFELTTFQHSKANTFYRCDSEQDLTFTNTTTTLFTNDVQLQAFNLKNGSFSGDGFRCHLDPTPSPMPPAAKPGNNKYTVNAKNVTCIVFEGEISFDNVTYTNTNKESAVAPPIVIPAMNESEHNVNYTGSCSLEGGLVQQLVVTFNNNWTLTLNFSKGGVDAQDMLGASKDQYRVRDIEFVYYLTPEFFPNASDPYAMAIASRTNLTTDFMKGAINGGSYKCNASQTETLDTGVEFHTEDLQYKAFNNDNSTTFNNNVMQCSADDESNSIVPIAVGAALAGLVAIVLIAYLIGRRRSRRQGYESV